MGWLIFQLKEIPPVAVEILEYGRRSVAFVPRCFSKFDAVRHELAVIVPEIVTMQEEKDAPAGLSSYGGEFLIVLRLCQQELTFLRAARGNAHPALTSAKVGILDQRKTHDRRVVGNSFIVIANQN